jgi:hypothetical protein
MKQDGIASVWKTEYRYEMKHIMDTRQKLLRGPNFADLVLLHNCRV